MTTVLRQAHQDDGALSERLALVIMATEHMTRVDTSTTRPTISATIATEAIVEGYHLEPFLAEPHTCPECGRVFDLTDPADADELSIEEDGE